MVSRRVLRAAGAGMPTLPLQSWSASVAPHGEPLASITLDAQPIASSERSSRVAKLQEIMGRRKVAALLIEPGASLEYFTGIRWQRSERVTLAAYPHGSLQRQTVREGSTILMDCGCAVLGYQSDISRTWVYGQPNARQRKVWNTVKRGPEITLESAHIGQSAGSIDDAVRSYYERDGWAPGYQLPELSHRTGHGIGLDGHEAPYLVHGDATALEAGMCFANEPGL